MACRLAGTNHTPEQLWESILSKRDASSEMPSWRWEPYLHRDARNAEAIKTITKRGYFVDALDAFDPVFFGISPKEAEQMDPQQRMALEVAWEALEHAGIDPRSLSGSDTAVFMGVNSDDYSKLLLEDLPNVDTWMGIGTAYCGVANRISYHLNLMGPSSAVDAACASSLVAIHHAHQALLAGESGVAIAGGVNALCGPGLTSVLDKAGATCPEGSCMSFDDGAHGYGRGEGAAVVVLKKLSGAIKDGDRILAVLKASAVAQDGKTNGIMAPNAKAQEMVARQALRQAGVKAETIQYVEAHATSTPLGDPTEVSAISAVYGYGDARRVPLGPVAIGSVKPNVGHLEAGAGAVGLIKAILAMQHATYPPQANLKTLNSKVDWEKSGTWVVRDAAEWVKPTAHPRRAAVCSYGYGGTVAHAIIEEPDHAINMSAMIMSPVTEQQSDEGRPGFGPLLLIISSPHEKRLPRIARALAQWLASPAGRKENLASIMNTLALRRAQHKARAVFVVGSHEEAADVLTAFAEGKNASMVSQDVILGPSVNKGVVWVFSGHGAQWDKMGVELLHSSLVFYHAVEPLDHIIRAVSGFSVLEKLRVGGFVEESDRVQVMTYIIQIGLAAVLRSKGIAPAAIVGHSVGEIAATVVAGSLTPEEGAVIVAKRAKLYSSVKGQGAMFMVNQPFDEIRNELGEDGDVVAAIHSSPSSCVVSGSLDSTLAYAEKVKSRGTKAMRVATDIAFHARKMLSPLAAPLKKALRDAGIEPRSPLVPLYSTSMADPRSATLRDADYWVHNMVNPVLLTSAIRAAADDGFRLFLEVSSHPIVSHSVNEILMDMEGIEDDGVAVVETMRRNESALPRIMKAVGSLYIKGADIDVSIIMGGQWCPSVPGTQWEHKSIWRKVESGAGALPPSSMGLVHNVQRHTLLGLRSPLAVDGSDMVLYTTILDDQTRPFPGRHPLHGTEIVPAAVLLHTFHHATGAATLSNITLRVPVAISAPRDVQVLVVGDNVKIASRLRHGIDDKSTEGNSEHDDHWVTHTTGRWKTSGLTYKATEVMDVEAIKRRINAVLPSSFSIDYLAKVGVSAMGFPWAVTEHHGNLKEMLARVDVAPDIAADAPLPWAVSSWAPILDAATSVGSTIFFDDPKLRMPAHIDKVHFYDNNTSVVPPKVGYLYVQEATQRGTHGGPAVHVSVCDEVGRLLVRFESMRFSEIEGTPGVSGSVESLVHQLAWVPAPLSNKATAWSRVVLVSDDETVLRPIGKEVARKLKIQAENILQLDSAAALVNLTGLIPIGTNTAIVYCPGTTRSLTDVLARSRAFIDELLKLTEHVINMEPKPSTTIKVFVLTAGVAKANTPTALAHSPLHGLARIVASEHPDQWGALIDIDEDDAAEFPALAIKYIRNQDVIRMQDQLPRIARLQPLPRELKWKSGQPGHSSSLLPKSEGTYLITGGLGALGLEVAAWLVEKGARRLVLVSRRRLPPRTEWATLTPTDLLHTAITRIQALEQTGATVYALSLDVGGPDAADHLRCMLAQLALPPVLGVVHAAGTLEDQLVREMTAASVARVLAPKIAGALVLDAVFPPGSLDWFVLFSSCGQLFGFPGQGSYAAGNAFLDALATRRRGLGDAGAVAIQWTSWRGLGMAASTEFVAAELESKGITDITVEEAFRAWEHLGKYDIDHGVVLRSLAFDHDEPLPVAILEDIAVRRSGFSSTAGGSDNDNDMRDDGAGDNLNADTDSPRPSPRDGPGLKAWLVDKIRDIIAGVLMLGGVDEIDPRAAIADLGVDSVMTVTLRRKLQSVLKVKVPPTLTWSHPTANHLAAWFLEKLSED